MTATRSRAKAKAAPATAAVAPKQRRGAGAPWPEVPAPWLQTLRLDLRAFVLSDLPDLVRLDTDPHVMRYIGKGAPAAPHAIAANLRRIIRYPRLYVDFGLWHTTRRDTGAFVGWFTLKYTGTTSDVEVGYRLLPDAWGQGFATEGARALVDYGFDELDLDRIIGVAHRDNVASQRVLQKCGLADHGWGHYYNERLRLFAATNPHRVG